VTDTQGFLILFGAAAVAVGAYRARRSLWRNVSYAPPIVRIGAQVALAAFLISLLVSGKRTTPLTWAAVLLIVAAALWGRWRYSKSPYLQRSDDRWAKLDRVLSTNPDEADRLLDEGQLEDERERQALRSRATGDINAARAFLAATERELGQLEASTRRHPEMVSIVAQRRARLEADRTWALTLVQNGAA
jgi:hypothetical protein